MYILYNNYLCNYVNCGNYQFSKAKATTSKLLMQGSLSLFFFIEINYSRSRINSAVFLILISTFCYSLSVTAAL